MHNAHPNVDHKSLVVAMNRCNMGVCFWPNMADVAVEKPMCTKNLIDTSPVDSEENW